MATAVNEGKNKELQARSKEILFSSNIIKSIMRSVGYSDSYVETRWKPWAKKWLKNIDLDAVHKRVRDKSGLLSETLIHKCFAWIEEDDPKWAQVAAKIHGDLTRAYHEDKTPSHVTFQLQTIQGETINLGDKSPNKDISTDTIEYEQE